jgi:hypothetical protein
MKEMLGVVVGVVSFISFSLCVRWLIDEYKMREK